MTDTITSLIEKLEGAEVGSRDLDGAVWYAVHEPDVEHGCLHVEQTDQGPVEVLTCELGSKYADCVGNYTTSLDAALALAERVLGEESALSMLQDTIEGWNAASGLSVKNLPRLFCAALLRAQSEAR